MIIDNNTILVGTVYDQGYIIKSAEIYLKSAKDINPESNVTIGIKADLIAIGRSHESWQHTKNIDLDIDNEKFLVGGEEVKVVNGKSIFNKIMRVLVGSMSK